jgi:hypothetical protein
MTMVQVERDRLAVDGGSRGVVPPVGHEVEIKL